MRKFLNKAKDSSIGRKVTSSKSAAQQQPLRQNDTPSTIQPATALEILRYRYHYGTNLGSIFVLEQWLSGSMFVSGATGGSELDAVNA